MKSQNKIWGALGEIKARNYLKAKKYKILGTNVENHCGEIDIIAQKDGTIVFVEVKARASAKFGLPREAVTTTKQNKIRSAAMLYLVQRNWTDKPIRFDVIEVLDSEITHIENCF